MYEWKANDNGNFIAIGDGGDLEATVFSKGNEWQIILNGDWFGRLVAGEDFDNSDDAMKRAEAIMNGADCTLVTLRPKDETTGWKLQKKISNGSPTYGQGTEAWA